LALPFCSLGVRLVPRDEGTAFFRSVFTNSVTSRWVIALRFKSFVVIGSVDKFFGHWGRAYFGYDDLELIYHKPTGCSDLAREALVERYVIKTPEEYSAAILRAHESGKVSHATE
jgi:hypothetical protein